MSPPLLTPGAADALLFDLGRVVLDIDFNKALTCWAGHAGCAPADIAARFVRDEILSGITRSARSTTPRIFAGLRQSLGIGLSDAQFLEGWNAIFAGEMPGIAPLLAARRTSVCRSMPSPTPTTPMSSISR